MEQLLTVTEHKAGLYYRVNGYNCLAKIFWGKKNTRHVHHMRNIEVKQMHAIERRGWVMHTHVLLLLCTHPPIRTFQPRSHMFAQGFGIIIPVFAVVGLRLREQSLAEGQLMSALLS